MAMAGPGIHLLLGYDRGIDSAHKCAAACREAGAEVEVAHIDLSDQKSIKEFLAALDEHPIDVLIHAAGAFSEVEWADTDADHLVNQFMINAAGPALVTQGCESRLRASHHPDGGCVIFFGDIHADMVPRGGATGYLVSKSATHALVKLLAIEMSPVRVYGIAPGVIGWPDDWSSERREKYLERVPLGRAGGPEDTVRLVKALVDHSAYVTGMVIPLDGGRHLR